MTAEPLCIFLDESGTPGLDDHVFVTAGIGIRGDMQRVKDAWDQLKVVELFPRKGKKYNRDQYLALVNFLLNHSVFPICSTQTLNKETAAMLRKRCDEFPQFRKATGLTEYSYAAYIWTQQLFGTIGHALIPLIRHFGPINSLALHVDQFTLKDEMRNFIIAQYRNMFMRGGLFEQSLNTTVQRYPDKAMLADITNEVLQGYQLTNENLSLNLQAKGPFSQLADAVAALYRNSKLKPDEARDPWQALCLAFEGRTVIDMDSTLVMEKHASLPWHFFE